MKTNAERIQSIISEFFGVPEKDVVPSKTLTVDLNADSLDTIELAMALGEEFDLTIPDDDIDACVTVADVIAMVERLIGVQR